MKVLWWSFLGQRDYRAVWRLQLDLVARRQRDEIPDVLVLVEHPDVITLGRRPEAMENVVAPEGVEVIEIERGGDVTYHGPGQLVGYPILKLEGSERDLHGYLRRIEQALIDSLVELGLPAERQEGLTGVWAQGRKLASIGVAVRKWVTFHGFALNVSTDLSRFSMIHPCGLSASAMGSMAGLLPAATVTLPEVGAVVARHFGLVMNRKIESVQQSELEASDD